MLLARRYGLSLTRGNMEAAFQDVVGDEKGPSTRAKITLIEVWMVFLPVRDLVYHRL